MPGVALVADSMACLPAELVRRYGITVMPAELVLDGHAYQDGASDISEMYRYLWKARSLKTSAPSPAAYARVFIELGRRHRGVLCVTLADRFSSLNSSALSAARAAQESLPACDIRVLDSGSATMGAGFVALAAARAAERGGGMDEVVAAAREVRARVRLLYMFDTLRYIARTGRLPSIAAAPAWAASSLKLRPVIKVENGEARPLTVVRTRAAGMKYLARAVAERADRDAQLHLAVVHALAADDACRLKEAISGRLACAEAHVVEASPIIAASAGPGLLGVAFYSH